MDLTCTRGECDRTGYGKYAIGLYHRCSHIWNLGWEMSKRTSTRTLNNALKASHNMTSTTWKSLAVGFGAGVVSTFLYFPVGSHTLGALGWGISLAYIAYQAYEAQLPSRE